jgi:hypothetical protein
MQALSIVLLLISIGTIVAPIGAVVVFYHNDLTQLVIPPQIRDIINGNSNIIPDISHSNNGDNSSDVNQELGGLMSPELISVQIDETTNTFTGIFQITNPVDYDLTLNSFSTDVEITQANIPAGNINLNNPVTVRADQMVQLSLSGQWSQQAQDYIASNYPDATSMDINLTNISINVNGIAIQSNGPIQISVPTNMTG